MQSCQKAEMRNRIEELIKNNKFDEKIVIAFGHCNATESMIDYLTDKGIYVEVILDNNNSKLGHNYHGIEIQPPSSALKYPNNSLVLVANRFYEQMKTQLFELGYLGEVIKIVEYNTFAEYSLSKDTINQKIERLFRGLEALNKIRKVYPSHFLVICPNLALGDVYWACAYLNEYKVKNNIKEIMVITVGEGNYQIADMFGYECVTLESTNKMNELVQAIIFNHEKDTIIASHDLPYTDNIIKYLNRHFISFTNYYKFGVFGLNIEAIPSNPSNLEPFVNKDGLLKNRSVIFAPYAKSVIELQTVFWENLAKDYIGKGFNVYTYVYGNEIPIPRTSPITVPLNQLISAVEYAGHFVGLRSGLCDVVSSANCQKTVIIPNSVYSTTSIKISDFFKMEGWNQI